MKEDEVGRACNMHGRKEKHERFWLENLKGGDHIEDTDRDGEINIRMDLGEIE
jgi:hypothetical protein